MTGHTRKVVRTATAGMLFMAAALLLPSVPLAVPLQPGRTASEPAGTETMPDEGRRHLEPGERWEYRSIPPTSGPHDPKWIKPGFHRTVQSAEKLVHSLEHGNVVIYYDRPAPEVLAKLREWARRHQGKWDGVVVAPLPGLGKGIVLTAWRKRLRLDPFDVTRAQAFIEAFRGHGPESGEKDME